MNTLVDYLTIACTGTGQSTFYNTKQDQTKALEDAHAKLLQENRRVYALTAAFPLNDRSRQLIVENLLNNGLRCEDGVLEGHIVSMLVTDLQFNRVLNLFMTLREKKVNNARTKNLGKIIWQMIDEYRAIKYRDKVRTVLRHCHIAEGTDPQRAEMHRWIFGKNAKRGRAKISAADIQHNPKIKARLEAPTNYEKLFELPFDIARDIAVAKHGKTAVDFEREFAGKEGQAAKGKVTRKETVRARQKTGDSSIDFERLTLQELYMHGFKTPADRAMLMPAIERRAHQFADVLALPPRVALVIDNSLSALGSAERRFQPLVAINCVVQICKRSESEVECYYVGAEPGEDGFIEASGASNLRMPLVHALMSHPDIVIILSDGYENVRSGSVNQILNTTAVRNSGIPVLHLNPVAAAEANAKIRTLSPLTKTIGITTPDQLPMICLVTLAAQDPHLLDNMFDNVEQAIKSGDYKAARLALRVTAFPALTA